MPNSLRRASLSAKIGTIGALLLTLALASIGLTLWVTWQLQGGAAAVNEAGRLRMQTWRLAQAAASDEPLRIGRLVRQFDETIALLEAGDPARPLAVPHDAPSLAAFDAVRSHWRVLAREWSDPAAAPNTTARRAEQAEAMVARIDTFVGAIESRLAHWTALLTTVQLALVGLSIAGGVAMLYTAYLFVFNPLARLQGGIARIEGGDLGARVRVDSRDEFGAVADGFNRMAATLQDFTRGLEAKVAEKTESLRAERERLSALYDGSACVARCTTLDELARGFARELRRAARADAAIVRWADAGAQRFAFVAADCLPAEMVDEERCIAHGDCDCGASTAAAGARVIPIRAAAAGARACERAGFTHLVAVPVRLHERLLGEVDLLFRSQPRLGDEDRALLDSLAAQLAGGIESLRAAALEREAAVSDERALLARELHDSIAQSLVFLKLQVQMLRGALARVDERAAAAALDELDAGVRESTADVRELLLHFRTRASAEDIVPALQTTVQKFQHQSGVTAHLDVRGHGVPLPADVQVQVLHVVQEALSNVRKHAQAREVWVEVQQQPVWRIEVRDDGVGFAPEAAADAGALSTQVGLRIMRERAASIGAEVQCESAPGAGTRVTITLPAGATGTAAAPARALAA